MDNLSLLIEEEISNQYKSIRQFSLKANIPQTTITSALRKGIGGTNYNNVIKICKILRVDAVIHKMSLCEDEVLLDIVKKYSLLDDYGKSKLKALIEFEISRL